MNDKKINDKKINDKKFELTSSKVQQGNDFVKSFYKMTPEQQNLFYFAVAVLDWKENPIDNLMHGKQITDLSANSFSAKFKIQQLFEKMDLPNTKSLTDAYKKQFGKLSQIVVKTKDQRGKEKYTPLFATTVWENNEINIVFNVYFIELIFQQKYTTADLRILGQLSKGARTNYAQRLYFYLAMYRNTQGQKQYHNDEPNSWTVEMTEEYFRDLVQMPKEKNPRKDAFRRCINGLISKINNINYEFSVNVKYARSTNKMTFLCTENMNLKKLEKDENAEMRIQKLEINKEQEEIKYFRKKYSEEFEKEYQNQLKNEVLDFGTSNKNLRNEIAEFEAYKIIKERYSLQ